MVMVEPTRRPGVCRFGQAHGVVTCNRGSMERRNARNGEKYGRSETIFTQGDACDDVLYIRNGGVKLSVLSKRGREAVVATIGAGDFFGEECLAGLENRIGNATAITPSVIVRVGKAKMAHLLHSRHAISDRFISHILSRHISMEEDLLDSLFTSSEEQVARALLRLAGYGTETEPGRVRPPISRDTLAGMSGITNSRVDVLLNKFKKLGFIDYDGEITWKIHRSLLSVVLRH